MYSFTSVLIDRQPLLQKFCCLRFFASIASRIGCLLAVYLWRSSSISRSIIGSKAFNLICSSSKLRFFSCPDREKQKKHLIQCKPTGSTALLTEYLSFPVVYKTEECTGDASERFTASCTEAACAELRKSQKKQLTLCTWIQFNRSKTQSLWDELE